MALRGKRRVKRTESEPESVGGCWRADSSSLWGLSHAHPTPPPPSSYLIQATQDQTNVNVPQMVDTLMERVGNASWVVVFKALITTHHLMVHGHEKFLQLLSSRNTLFNLSNFLDKTGSHGFDMSTFIRRYGRYLNEKSFAYRQMSFDFVRVKKGAEGAMRTMSVEKLLKGMPILQSQIDALLDFEVQPKDLNNGVINACFLLLFKDLIKLYACYNDGIINLLGTSISLTSVNRITPVERHMLSLPPLSEKFFQMKRSQCKDGLEIYKRFLTRMTRVSDFFKIAEQMGIDKNDIPELTQAPESLLESLETHLNTLEGKKPMQQPTTPRRRLVPQLSPPPRLPLHRQQSLLTPRRPADPQPARGHLPNPPHPRLHPRRLPHPSELPASEGPSAVCSLSLRPLCQRPLFISQCSRWLLVGPGPHVLLINQRGHSNFLHNRLGRSSRCFTRAFSVARTGCGWRHRDSARPGCGCGGPVLDGLGDLLMPAVTPQSTGGSTTGSMAGSMGTPITPGVAAVPPATPPPTKTIGGVLDSALDNLIGGKW
ncbi:unnamed protein product [Tetraodon nigroviridis]|uniref:(spotted green pufferfish) hypothetical protein n=1 Tax=Tetraodon nigroviridis TaxID=99883 RepID=Q4SSY1_TETNG|nr:unnamed protein product [Tetraodon nigroviridis]